MCSGIALALCDIPVKLFEEFHLEERVFKRGGESEVRFFFGDRQRYLPILYEGQFRIVQWGSHRRESPLLPIGGWTTVDALKKNTWCNSEIVSIEIPATMGFEKGIWFRIRQGISGVLIIDKRKRDVAYMLCEKSSHYFQVMTRSLQMPVLVDEKF